MKTKYAFGKLESLLGNKNLWIIENLQVLLYTMGDLEFNILKEKLNNIF